MHPSTRDYGKEGPLILNSKDLKLDWFVQKLLNNLGGFL